MMLCDLLNTKRFSGRPALTIDTECSSRASRALASMTLVRQAAAREIAVPSGIEHETWIDGDRAVHWMAAGWITVVLMTCCIRMGLVWFSMVASWTSR